MKRINALLLLLALALGAFAAEKAFLGVEPDGTVNIKAGDFVGRGIKISRVIEDSPAERAGLAKGDILTDVGGKKVEDADDLSFFLGRFAPGDRVELGWWRDGRQIVATAELDAWSKHMVEAPIFEKKIFTLENRAFLGVGTLAINNNLLEHFGVKDGHGVLVDAVVKGSSAETAGLKVGDVIVDLDGRAVDSPGRLRRLLQDQKPGNKVKLLIVRDRQQQTLTIQLGDRDMSEIDPASPPRMPALPSLPPLPELPSIEAVGRVPGVRALGATIRVFGHLLGAPLACARP